MMVQGFVYQEVGDKVYFNQRSPYLRHDNRECRKERWSRLGDVVDRISTLPPDEMDPSIGVTCLLVRHPPKGDQKIQQGGQHLGGGMIVTILVNTYGEIQIKIRFITKFYILYFVKVKNFNLI